MKVFLPTKMKCGVMCALIWIAFLSQAFAVLRPLVPTKPEPPFKGEQIIVEDESLAELPTLDLVAPDCSSPPGRLALTTRVLISSVQRADAEPAVY